MQGYHLINAIITAIILVIYSASSSAMLVPVGTGDTNVVGSSTPEAGTFPGARDEDNIVNGSGLDTTGQYFVNTGQPNGNNWNTETSTAFITFDLGTIFNIDFIQIWNFNDSFGNNDFGPTSIDILVSNVGTNATDADFSGSSIITTLSIAEATGSLMYFGENYRFNGKTEGEIPSIFGGTFHDHSAVALQGRFIRFANLDGSTSFGGRTGLSEVRFYASPVPIPAAVWLFGSALIALVGFRRSR
jgi:hypothetical protein